MTGQNIEGQKRTGQDIKCQDRNFKAGLKGQYRTFEAGTGHKGQNRTFEAGTGHFKGQDMTVKEIKGKREKLQYRMGHLFQTLKEVT